MNPHPKASNTVHFLQVCLNPGMHGRVDPLFADTLRQPRALERIPNRGAGPGQPQLCSSLLQLFSQLAQSVDTLYVQPGGCLGVKKDHPDRGLASETRARIRPRSTWTLAKKSCASSRKINNPGTVRASGWRSMSP